MIDTPYMPARPDAQNDPRPLPGTGAGQDIPVTRTFLPPLEEYTRLLEQSWEKAWITNHGPFCMGLEVRLREHLQAPELYVLCNGTVALQIAIKALDLKGEVIVTPFSYVATVSSAVWEGCTPVFADIESDTLTIDPKSVEAAITPRTTAILATHVFGNPCDVDALQDIAERHGLRVIYDGAHAFGVKFNGRPILDHGDITTLSFHATKLFHTVEGGAAIARDPEVGHRISYMRNFGHDGPEAFQGVGINGKMSEPHAIMGHLVLDRIEHIRATRAEACSIYRRELAELPGTRSMTIRNGTEHNHSYFPIIFASEERLLRVRDHLRAHNVQPRRYFYPSLDTLPYVSGLCPISRDIAGRILCLPLYADMEPGTPERIARLVREALC